MFCLCIGSGDLSKSECFELLCFPHADVLSLEGFSGAVFNEPCHSDPEGNNRGKQPLRSEAGQVFSLIINCNCLFPNDMTDP